MVNRIFRPAILVLVALAAASGPADAFAAPKKQKAAPAAVRQGSDSEDSEGDSPTKRDGANGTSCRAEALVDGETGEQIDSFNGDEALRPASMVKLMLAWVVYHTVDNGGAKWDDPVTVSAKASKIGGSQVYLKEDEQFTLQDLLQAVLIQSANDAAMAIAEHIGGSSEGFVDIMNQEAKNLGMTSAVFRFPHGLPPGKDQEPDLVSAADFARLAHALISKYPQVLDTTKLESCDFRDGTFKMNSHNHLLKSFAGCDGLKTGYYTEAGFSITATAQRNGRRMIAVVMGCQGRKERDTEAARLLGKGFAQYRSVKLIEKGSQLGIAASVPNGTPEYVPIVAGADAFATIKSGQESKVEKKFDLCTNLQPPVEAGTECGTVALMLDGRELGRIPAQVQSPVGKASVFQRAIGLIK